MSWMEWLAISGLMLASLATGCLTLRGHAPRPTLSPIAMHSSHKARLSIAVIVTSLCAIGGMLLLPWAASLPAVPLWAGVAFAVLLLLGAVWADRDGGGR